IFGIDQEDLYIYDIDPADPSRYRYKGNWEQFRVIEERVRVRDAPDATVRLLFSRHGPVVHVDAQRHRAYAIRSVWFEPGTAAYFGSFAYMRAKSFAEFKAALGQWGTPAENQAYADTAGHIGLVSRGLAPRRPNWDGLLPVPGDGRYEW